jgi:hypothetical protein
MTIHVRPEIRQGGFQRTLGGYVPLVGPERLNKARVDVVVRGTPEEANSGVLERPDVPIPGVEKNFNRSAGIGSAMGMTLPVLGALLNTCGYTIRERDLRAVQPGLMVAHSRDRGFEILF